MKRRVWVWTAALFGGMAVLAGFAFWDAQRRATEVFDRHRLEVAAILVEIRVRDSEFAPIREPRASETGWTLYTAALDAADAVPAADTEQITESNGPTDPEVLDALFVKHAGVTALLRKTLTAGDFTPAYRYEEGLSMELPYVSKAIGASKYLAAAAARRHALGRDGEALDLTLPIVQVGHMTARGGSVVNHLVGLVCEDIARESVRAVLSSHSLAAADLARFAADLDAFSKARPSLTDAFRMEDVATRQTLHQLDQLGTDSAAFSNSGIAAGRSWKFLFSRRLAYANGLGEMERFYGALREELDRLPPYEAIASAEKRAREAVHRKNPLAELLLPSVKGAVKREAVARMHWTLMRVAVAIAWYEAEKATVPTALSDLVPRHLVKVPECPYTGKPFGYGAGKVWSVGGDGVDDGGKPLADEDNEDSPGDVVWTVKRK